ncbi:MAG TPA: alpha/beta fold hydrolase [Candidatus Thermoplasmatota archaeon]|nr:alpha/beta fold hydrolase [Candidatus Thermoplasmatota archaeon]
MRLLALLLVLVLVAPLAPATHGASLVSPYAVCPTGGACHPKQMATGLLAVPEGEPLGLIVILHGYGHNASSHRAHLGHLAAQGYVAVAMDYRGTGFPLAAGAEDTRAAIADLESRFDFPTRILYSVSMGTAVAALVLPHERFDVWVNNEGLSMLHETWAGAALLAPSGNPTAVKAKADIEAECGGTPADAPECYLARSAALRVAEFDVGAVVLAHGLNDGIVPYNHGREMVAALRAHGIASDFYTVVRSNPGGEGTTLSGYTPAGTLGLAGHGTESNATHALTSLSIRLLDEVLAGTLVPADRERVHDHGLGTLP